MTREIATLIVELTGKLENAFAESDEKDVEIAGLREQRQILFHQLHEAEKRTRELQRRLHELIDSHRALRARLAEFERVAA